MMKIISFLLAALVIYAPALYAADFYISPTGKSSNQGSKESPWDIVTALSNNTISSNKNSVVKPGDTLWLTQGTYGNGAGTNFSCSLVGTKTQPIIVRQAPGQRAVINGTMSVGGAWSTLWGFEVMNSNTTRKTDPALRGGGINFYTPYHKAINLIVHDVGHPGIGIWTSSVPAAVDATENIELYGIIMWGNGIYDTTNPSFPDGWTRGSGVYAQNQYGKAIIEQMISFKQFTIGLKVYTQGGYANNFELINNVVFDNNFEEGMLYGTATNNPINAIKVIDNYTYSSSTSKKSSSLELGFRGGDLDQIKAIIQGNYFAGRYWGGLLSIVHWKNLEISNNTFITIGEIEPDLKFSMRLATYFPSFSPEVLSWNNNSYYGGHSADTFYVNGNSNKSWEQWKTSTGFDQNSTRQLGLPTQNRIFILPNKYESGRAHIVVYNWEKLDQVSVNLSTAGMQNGDRYAIYDVQNLLGAPVAQGIYNGAEVTLPTNLTAITPLIGAANITHFNPSFHTDSGFNTYLLVRETSTNTPLPPKNLLAF